jgi:hypothetical protein
LRLGNTDDGIRSTAALRICRLAAEGLCLEIVELLTSETRESL